MNRHQYQENTPNSRTIHLTDAVAWLFAFFAFCASNPYFLWRTFLGGYIGYVAGVIPTRSVVALLALIAAGYYILKRGKINRLTSVSSIRLLGVVFFMLVISGGSNNKPFSTTWITFLCEAVFLLMPTEVIIKSLKIYKKLFAVTLIPALIIYIMTVWLKIGLPYFVLAAESSAKTSLGYSYKCYILSVQLYRSIDSNLRFMGIYYEAGFMGTLCAMLLTTDRYRLRGEGTFLNKVLFVSGCCSLSLAFFAITIIYLVLFNLQQKKVRNYVYFFTILIAYFLFVSIPISNPSLHRLQSRVMVVDGQLQGDNRSSKGYQRIYESLYSQSADKILMGMGSGAFAIRQAAGYNDGSSYKSIIYDYGIIGFGLYILWYFAYPIKMVRIRGQRYSRFLPFVVVQVASIYQLPSIFNPSMLLIFCAEVLYESAYTQVSSEDKVVLLERE